MMSEQESAMRARDAEHLVSRRAPETVMFDLAPPLRQAGPKVQGASGLRSWFAGFDGPIDFEIRDLSVTAGADVAFCQPEPAVGDAARVARRLHAVVSRDGLPAQSRRHLADHPRAQVHSVLPGRILQGRGRPPAVTRHVRRRGSSC
jgi:ketosteroid isomerase-like protein